MTSPVHRIYVGLLFTLGIGTAVVVGINGCEYYTTSQERIGNLRADLDARVSDIDVELEMQRQGLGTSGKSREHLLAEKRALAHRAGYWDDWKPTGRIGHGLGIVGSAMMIAGVIAYSSRKRVRRLRYAGKIKHWLEFHIFLCLLGPTLVLYHTTFVFGGIVAVSAWSMIFVAVSGLLGRYIYTQIPKGIEGNELTLDDLTAENERMRAELSVEFGLSDDDIAAIDRISRTESAPRSTGRALLGLLTDDFARRTHMRHVRARLAAEGIPRARVAAIMRVAKRKSLLLRRVAFLETARAIFHYWHVVHLPFSIIMFVILAVHVAVTVSLGYRWIF